MVVASVAERTDLGEVAFADAASLTVVASEDAASPVVGVAYLAVGVGMVTAVLQSVVFPPVLPAFADAGRKVIGIRSVLLSGLAAPEAAVAA